MSTDTTLTDLTTHSEGNINTKHVHACLFYCKQSEAITRSQPSIYIADTASKSHIILLSHSLPIDTQSMAFLGETSSQTIVNSRLAFIFPNGSIIHNDTGVYFQTSTPVPIRVPNSCDFASLKTRIHNTLQLSVTVYFCLIAPLFLFLSARHSLC